MILSKYIKYKINSYIENTDVVLMLSPMEKDVYIMDYLNFNTHNMSYINTSNIIPNIFGYYNLLADKILPEYYNILKDLKIKTLYIVGGSRAGGNALLLANYLQEKISCNITVIGFSPIIKLSNSILEYKNKKNYEWSDENYQQYEKYKNLVDIIKNAKFDSHLFYSGKPLYDFDIDEKNIKELVENNTHFKTYFVNYDKLVSGHHTFFHFAGHKIKGKLIYELIIKIINNEELDGWDCIIKK
jgi:hypothetical protein